MNTRPQPNVRPPVRRTLRGTVRSCTWLLAALPAACAAVGGGGSATELVAHRADTAPVTDGRGDDAAWSGAPELAVRLEGAAGTHDAKLRAVVHDGTLHLLVRWNDTTEDREHKVWTPKAEGGFAAGPEREDVFAIGFPISGEFTGDMLSPVECVWDVWQWKSFRTDPAGYAMDKSHVHSFTDPGGKRYVHELADGRKLHIVRPEDKGTSATKTLKAPESGGRTPQYAAQVPSGSASDVRARGTWQDGTWTLELSRPLSTGHADDAELAGRDTVAFSLAILDRADDEDHAVSPLLSLRLR